MQRDPRYDILFEPVRIGPVTAKNRFFQVPHCNGMGHAMPEAHAAMRAAKAEGGWAVVSTEECEIHPSGDISPYVEARLWDDQDITRDVLTRNLAQPTYPAVFCDEAQDFTRLELELLLRLNLFTYRDLDEWLADPLSTPPLQPQQLPLLLA